MSNSSLVSYTKISPNKTSPRNHKIDTITIHCVVGQFSLETLGNIFSSPSTQASCNYGISYDGKVGMYVEEKDRSWCSSNRANDNRAITIEVASDTTHPYAVKKAAYDKLIDLLVDICKRNGIPKLLWKADKNLIGQVDKQNMTVHRWFANKDCPGEYLYSRHGEIARLVNQRLSKGTSINTKNDDYLVQVTSNNLNIRQGPGTNYPSNGFMTPGTYTIVKESSGQGSSLWGKLKSGAGWISLDYCKKI